MSQFSCDFCVRYSQDGVKSMRINLNKGTMTTQTYFWKVRLIKSVFSPQCAIFLWKRKVCSVAENSDKFEPFLSREVRFGCWNSQFFSPAAGTLLHKLTFCVFQVENSTIWNKNTKFSRLQRAKIPKLGFLLLNRKHAAGAEIFGILEGSGLRIWKQNLILMRSWSVVTKWKLF